MTSEGKRYNLIVWGKVEDDLGVVTMGERLVLTDSARYEIALMSGNYWAGKFPDDIVMLVEV